MQGDMRVAGQIQDFSYGVGLTRFVSGHVHSSARHYPLGQEYT
jgi:hypothetical protein